jgi:hypothetical protein
MLQNPNAALFYFLLDTLAGKDIFLKLNGGLRVIWCPLGAYKH